jgi:hypothetical protein
MRSSPQSPSCTTCRTRQLTNGVWECLSEDPQLCPNSLEFGFSHHICRHPEPANFLGNLTNKLGKTEYKRL